LLNGNGFNCGTVDGDFGSKTDTALRAYKKSRNLTADGICDKNTWTEILT
jgi:peptidoglycan hydrolase-like protein with peptidoglycan-binding domain